MERIKNENLLKVIERAQGITGRKYALAGAYGMSEIVLLAKDETTTLSGVKYHKEEKQITGFGSKREVYDRFQSYILGLTQ